jgi:glutathione S-transferase
MADPILYSFRRCPYAMRARLALLISETAFELREVKLSAKPPEMVTASPKGTVPVLVLADGQVIDESLDIMRWALRRRDPERWLDGDERGLIATNDGAFKHHLDRYKYPHRYGSDPLEHRAAAFAILAVLEDRLCERPWLCGANRSLVDAALMPFVRQFAVTDQGWFDDQDLPSVRRWLGEQIQSRLFERAMIRIEPWTAGGPGIMMPTEG